jgi:beta-glucuronidase
VRELKAALAALVVGLAAAGPARAEEPAVRDGHTGRVLLGGDWGFARTSKGPFARVTVPNAWNARDDSPASMAGGVGWYRKDFRLPRAPAGTSWRVRFEGVNHRARVSLNGRLLGEHAGAYLPWELPLTGARRGGVNRLLVRVDSRRTPRDLPPAGINAEGVPSGGWFTSSGIIREVTIRPVRGVDLAGVDVRPELPCARCSARVRVRAVLRGGATTRTVRVAGTFGRQAIPGETVRVPAGGTREVVQRITVRRPRLWSPSSPALYAVRLRVTEGGSVLAGWDAHSGIRSVDVRDGRLRFNGEPTSLRGVGYHEETREHGMALTHDDRAWLVREAKALGATMLRTHYPPGADLLELADREGLLVWSEVPVYSVKSRYLAEAGVRRRALDTLAENVAANGSHPSVAVWSIGNELSPAAGPAVTRYVREASALVHRLDPARPAALAIQAYPSALCKADRYAPLDLLGVNDYFGWYGGPSGELFDRAALSGFLDALRACYTRQALMVTEFGAEANRDGPPEEKGSWAFQQDFVNFHLGVFATKPWLSGALYWALNEFRVRPLWAGGNPRPVPPVHQKGLLTYETRQRKPAWEDVHRWYSGQVPGAPAPVPPQ